MSAGIITVIIVIVAIVAVAVVAGVLYDRRRRRLRQRFGPEYDRLVEERESRRGAEAELAEREKRVRGLDIRPLDPAARSRYADQWASIQERFVDAPQPAAADAQRLVMAVMSERGYPTEGNEQVLADLSVDHASTLDHYRAAYDISQRAADDLASTEDLRQAMIHYRALFQDLLGQPGTLAADEPENVTPEPENVTPERDAVASERDAVASEPEVVTAEPESGVTGQLPSAREQVPEEAVPEAREQAPEEAVPEEAEVAAADVPRHRRR